MHCDFQERKPEECIYKRSSCFVFVRICLLVFGSCLIAHIWMRSDWHPHSPFIEIASDEKRNIFSSLSKTCLKNRMGRYEISIHHRFPFHCIPFAHRDRKSEFLCCFTLSFAGYIHKVDSIHILNLINSFCCKTEFCDNQFSQFPAII